MGTRATGPPLRPPLPALPRPSHQTLLPGAVPRRPQPPCGHRRLHVAHPAIHPPRHRASPLARAARDVPGDPFDDFDAQFESMSADMYRMQRRMDAEMERMMRESREVQRRALERVQESQPGVRIERREESYPGGYSYSESVVVSSGGMVVAHQAPAPLFGSIGVFALALVACIYAVGTALFNRNFKATAFREGSRWRLSALWPWLLIVSPKFRRQFWAAVRARGGPSELPTSDIEIEVPSRREGEESRGNGDAVRDG
ncbi:unnamed protein product [Ostreobium quekettii]|uniref:Uncharacterized protein n=1 Tax=Ostreobium quekettii TaxID=121088 RepID=A0A8S1JFF0_9CHLO|nr:unnamed protein product [Ostreobium quekettii]